MSEKFTIQTKRQRWEGYGSSAPPGHNIKVFCNNRLLADKDNLSEVEEYLLVEKWKKLSRKSGFAKILSTKPEAFSLCHFCKKILVEGGGSVWDITFCDKCRADGLVDEYSNKKQTELNQYRLDQDRKIAEDNEKRKAAVQSRLHQLRAGALIGKNQRGEFRINDKVIAFVPYKAEWAHEIIEAEVIAQ